MGDGCLAAVGLDQRRRTRHRGSSAPRSPTVKAPTTIHATGDSFALRRSSSARAPSCTRAARANGHPALARLTSVSWSHTSLRRCLATPSVNMYRMRRVLASPGQGLPSQAARSSPRRISSRSPAARPSWTRMTSSAPLLRRRVRVALRASRGMCVGTAARPSRQPGLPACAEVTRARPHHSRLQLAADVGGQPGVSRVPVGGRYHPKWPSAEGLVPVERGRVLQDGATTHAPSVRVQHRLVPLRGRVFVWRGVSGRGPRLDRRLHRRETFLCFGCHDQSRMRSAWARGEARRGNRAV